MNLLPYGQNFVREQMAKDAPMLIRGICLSPALQSMMSWFFSMLVAQKLSPDLPDLEPEYKAELWAVAKDVIHNSGFAVSKELGITMCKSLIVIQMLK